MPIGAQSKCPGRRTFTPAFQMNKKIQILRAIAIIGVVMILHSRPGLARMVAGKKLCGYIGF